MKTLNKIGSGLFVLMALAGDAVVAQEHAGMEHSPMTMAIADKKGADFESSYLGLMIRHHQGGMPMWAMVREKATDAELKAMEKKTTPKEKAEVEMLTGWVKKLHGKTPADFSEPEKSKTMMEKDMAELKAASGKSFDAVFSKKMAHHHMVAIEMSKLAETKAQSPEVKKFAKEVIESQSKDREKLLGIAKTN